MDEFEKVRDDLLTKQLGKDYKKFQKPRKNMPTEDDMGPSLDEIKKERAKQEMIKSLQAPAGMGSMAPMGAGMKKGGKVKCMAKGGKVSQLSKANGCVIKGKSKGRMV